MWHPIKHFVTITRHRHTVIKHCARAGILWQGLFHDLSKYSPAEFILSAKHYVGYKSPIDFERLDLGYSRVWLHHQGRNRHHFEYWRDYNPETKMIEPVEMPTKYLVEMFCDRVAASKIYQGEKYTPKHPLEYFLAGKDRMSIHKKTSEQLESLLRLLAEKGEDEAFRFIRTEVLGKSK